MPALSIYLDECVDRDLTTRLQARGFSATSTYAEGMSGAADQLQLEFDAQHDWTILSHNKRDYQLWHRASLQQGRTHSGIILLRQSPLLATLEPRAVLAQPG